MNFKEKMSLLVTRQNTKKLHTEDTNTKIQKMQARVTEGVESGAGTRSMQELAKIARQSL